MIARRTLLSSALALAVMPLVAGSPVLAEPAPAPLRVASVKFGSLSWLLETIKAEGLDKKHGLAIDVIELASNQASAITLYGGSADVVVSDWPWALRQRGNGEAVKFAPFSGSLGAVMVPKDSSIKSLGDLEGKRLGVAGSAIDKSWLLLRAYGKKRMGKDLAGLASPQYGAAPILAEQLKDGRIDAVLNFWTYSARLEGSGYRRLISMSDVMRDLGVDPQPALVGFIWKEADEVRIGKEINALLAAAAEGNAMLAKNDGAWERLRPLMKAADESEFKALRAGYRAGIPGPWSSADMASAEKIMKLLVETGDTELVGHGTRFDPELFHTPGT